MINSKTAIELQGIAALGGSLEVDGSRYTALELQGIAALLWPNAYLKVHNSASKTAMEMQDVASIKPGQVVFA